ncbi:MAG: hypothetical protein HY363_01375 [Candidatus Aenigmarchaeota archaeon]|nr:hypothetical protein [Candidatus Aenigmarchaeota archaeon]
MVAVVVHGPPWFFLLDAALAFFGLAAAMVIVLLSMKALNLTKERKFLYFTIAFTLTGMGLFVRSVTNVIVFLIIPYVDKVMSSGLRDFRGTFFFVGYGLFIVCSIIGYVLLAVSTMKIREPRITILLTVLVLLLLGLSSSYFFAYYLTAITLLGFITFHVCKNCLERKSKSAFLVFFSFLLQFVAHIAFVLESVHPMFYYFGSIALLGGYGVLLTALANVLVGRR